MREDDLRYIKLKKGLSQLTVEELQRILDYKGEMVYDTYNYEESTGRW